MFEVQLPVYKWIKPRLLTLEKATIGQMIILIRLTEAESVADLGGSQKGKYYASAGVNARQKLVRLEKALGLGPLTRRAGKYTQPTETGMKVAAEARLLLQGLSSINLDQQVPQSWVIASGAASLQSVITPALARLAQKFPEWQWITRDLRAHDVVRELKNGHAQFGFIRTQEAKSNGDLSIFKEYPVGDLLVVAGMVNDAPLGAAPLLRWLVEKKRPLVQQATTWKPFSERADEIVRGKLRLSDITPHVLCVSHAECLSAARFSNSWGIVPATLRPLITPGMRVEVIRHHESHDHMALVYYDRALSKFVSGEKAGRSLAQELANTILQRDQTR